MALCIDKDIKNGEIKRKFLRFYKKQFQWDLFKKLFIVRLQSFRFHYALKLYIEL